MTHELSKTLSFANYDNNTISKQFLLRFSEIKFEKKLDFEESIQYGPVLNLGWTSFNPKLVGTKSMVQNMIQKSLSC